MNVIPLHNYPSMAVFQDSSVLEKPKNQKSIVVPTQESLEVIHLDEILYLKSDSNYTLIKLLQEELLISKTLKSFDEKLNHTFLRVHHSYLINPAFIKSFYFKTHSLLLQDGTSVPVSRRKKNEVMAYLKGLEI